MSRDDVARMAGVPSGDVAEVGAYQVRAALAGVVPADVLEVATSEAATYYLAAGSYWLVDPSFRAEPSRIEDLRYSGDLGLYHRSLTGE